MIAIDAHEAFRNQVKANYDFVSWANQAQRSDGGVQVRDFRIASEELEGWKLLMTEALRPSERQRRITRYGYGPSGEARGPRLILTVLECHSILDAHETLIDMVMTYMAPRLPRFGSEGLAIGDIGFGSHGTVSVSAIFARFNILVEILRASPEAGSIDEFARGVDALISRQHRLS